MKLCGCVVRVSCDEGVSLLVLWCWVGEKGGERGERAGLCYVSNSE